MFVRKLLTNTQMLKEITGQLPCHPEPRRRRGTSHSKFGVCKVNVISRLVWEILRLRRLILASSSEKTIHLALRDEIRRWNATRAHFLPLPI